MDRREALDRIHAVTEKVIKEESQESIAAAIEPPASELEAKPIPEPPAAPASNKHVKQDVRGSAPTVYDPNLWTEYSQDVFYGVLWQWNYKPEIDNTPRNLKPLCPECDREMSGQSFRNGPYESLQCPYHPQRYKINEERSQSGDPFPKTKKMILQKLKDGTWLDVVNKYRMLRHEAPISPSQVAYKPNVPDQALDEIQTEILIALAQEGGSCPIERLEARLGYTRNKKGKEPLDRVTLDYHLHELLVDEYITTETDHLEWKYYSLLQKGRAYLVKNKLLTN